MNVLEADKTLFKPSNLLIEFEEERSKTYRRNAIMSVLAPLYGVGDRDSILNFDAANSEVQADLKKAPASKLFDIYQDIGKSLTRLHPEVMAATVAEISIWRRIEAETRLEFWRSAWIGPYNGDVFFPAIGGNPRTSPRSKGLVLEINGRIHDHEIKGKKDTQKLDYLASLGIMVGVVENHDFNSPTVRALIKGLKDMPRISSRDRADLKNRIAIETIATHGSDATLEYLFGNKFFLVLKHLIGAHYGSF